MCGNPRQSRKELNSCDVAWFECVTGGKALLDYLGQLLKEGEIAYS
jgi:hypothetical protein